MVIEIKIIACKQNCYVKEERKTSCVQHPSQVSQKFNVRIMLSFIIIYAESSVFIMMKIYKANNTNNASE